MISGRVLRRVSIIAMSLGAMLVASAGLARQQSSDTVMTAELVGPIGPATAGFIVRALEDAEDAGAQALVIEMDTPGGLDTAMRDINQAILSANLPVIVYVSPPGARATSAGAYIAYASHIAAMAPGTSIGAATPVQMGGGGGEPPSAPAPEGADPAVEEAAQGPEGGDTTGETESDGAPAAGGDAAPSSAQAMRNKVVNDSVAYIRSLAELRGRNADWAESAVRDGISAPAEEALELNVVDEVAQTLPALLEAISGREVALQSGRTVTLDTAGASVRAIEKTFAEEVLAVITDPNIAFLLMNLGFIGLLVSFYNGLEPITAVAGVICLIVGLYALNTLPLNYAGAALILLGLALLGAEAFIASGGLLALGGLAAFAIGALMLVDTEADAFRLDWRLVAGATVALGGTGFLLVSYGLAAQGRKVTTGDQGLIGLSGSVLDWSGSKGHVHVDGERWSARSKDELEPGDDIKVTGVDGLTLVVKKIK